MLFAVDGVIIAGPYAVVLSDGSNCGTAYTPTKCYFQKDCFESKTLMTDS